MGGKQWWVTDRYTMPRELGYRVYLVDFGNGIRKGYESEGRRGEREGRTEKEKRERGKREERR